MVGGGGGGQIGLDWIGWFIVYEQYCSLQQQQQQQQQNEKKGSQ